MNQECEFNLHDRKKINLTIFMSKDEKVIGSNEIHNARQLSKPYGTV